MPAAPTEDALDATDRALLNTLAAAPAKVGDLIARNRYKEAQLEAMKIAFEAALSEKDEALREREENLKRITVLSEEMQQIKKDALWKPLIR